MKFKQRLGLILFLLGICGWFDWKYSGSTDLWVLLFMFSQLLGIILFLTK
jgi:hypothetical protein